MPTSLLSLTVAIILVMVGIIIANRTSAYRRWRADRAPSSVGLALDPSTRPVVERALALRESLTAAGAAAALAGVAVYLLMRPAETPVDTWILLAAFFVGAGAGSAVGGVIARPRVAEGQPRVARARELAIADYVAPIEYAGARVVVVLAVVAVIVAVALTGTLERERANLTVSIVLGILALVALVLFELVGRIEVGRPSPAVDSAALAWEDALRSQALRSLVTAPLTIGLAALMFAVITALGALPSDATGVVVTLLVPVILVVLAGVVAAVAASSAPQRHFLRVLWPATAAARGSR